MASCTFVAMKRFQILLLSCVLLLSAVDTSAQKKPEKTPEQKAKSKTTEMVQLLKLNPEQEQKIYEINLKAYQSIEKYEAKKPGKSLKKKQKDIVQSMREKEFQKILTPAQYQSYQKAEKEEDIRKEKEKAEKKKKKEEEKKMKAKAGKKSKKTKSDEDKILDE